MIFYPGVFVFWLIVHTNIQRLRALGTRAYWVSAIAWPITAGPLLIFRHWIFSLEWKFPQPLDGMFLILGVFAFILALVIFAQARKQISHRTMIGMPEIEPHKNKQPLLNSGIYSLTRNPIYLAHWLLVLSAAAVADFAANWIMFVADCLVLPLLIRAEERELLMRYGSEFAGYMRRVPRFFPQLR